MTPARGTLGVVFNDRTRSGHAREQRVPRAMVLCAIGPRASEPTFQHAQLPYLIDVELSPSMRCTALTLAADLKPKQSLAATPESVVVRLDNSGASSFVV